ncbi:protein KBP homolog [Bombyx mandarina]|uniref:KIF-binding protein n=1 Tax=Bombyx mandarina TaxID=7092 RepID=A0A6J2JLY4_BOMMA|nr:protein KBP homolog [Bombyx mandarina]
MTREMSAKEILNDFKENYIKFRKLLDEDSKNDPENAPYFSKYKAKEILNNMYVFLKTLKTEGSPVDDTKLDAMIGYVLLNIGIVEMDTEEPTASEKSLNEAVDLLLENALKPEIVVTLINVYNNIGILWSNRDDPEKAKASLVKGKTLYEDFKCTLQMPLPIEVIINYVGETLIDDFMYLEKSYTLTLYYLAQVFGVLKENLKSAIYCHVTLRRQLEYNDYEPIDWALNSATLSQFFAEQNGFYQSRNHLAAASTILDQYKQLLEAAVDQDEEYLAKLETFKHRSADVARCWAKYCLLLMIASKTRLLDDDEKLSESITDMSNLSLEDTENICEGNLKKLTFPNLDVTKYESKIGDKFLLTYEDARAIFLSCQNWLNQAKEYYKLETLASDYIELILDSSQAYNNLAFFEDNDDRRAKMLKRRIDMLENLLNEINPTYYLQYCRQIWYELGVVYTDILNIKIDKWPKSEVTVQARKKIDLLCDKSIESYTNFINSINDKNGKVPAKIDQELIRPLINALVAVGRNSMKRMAVNKINQLCHVQKSLDSYQTVVDICDTHEEVAVMFTEEYKLCQEMCQILPLKIKKLQTEIAG